jgi:probable HAF family extracellular repeat protein
MVGLGFLPGGGQYGGMAWSASADGSVIVGYSDTSTAFMQAFRWTQAGGMVALPDLPGGNEFSEALGVSADGSVAVGQGTSDAGIEACVWTTDGAFGLGSLPGGEYRSQARAISADGTVVVGGSRSELSGPDAWEMFRWTEQDGMIGLGDLPGGDFGSYAYDTSVDGSVLVGTGTSQRGLEAAVWDAGHGLRSVYDILTGEGHDLSGWSLTSATGVSDDGLTIVGTGTNPAGDTEAWIARIPEPATLSLLAFGLAAVLRRR